MAMISSPKGSNAERSRSSNRRAVMGYIHSAGEMGRAEIARNLSLSTQAVSNIIAELLEDGLLHEKGTRASGRGLPALQYGVNPDGGYAFGIEVRPNAILAALLDMQGKTVFTHRITFKDARPAAVISHVTALRDKMIAAIPSAQDKLLGAGIVMPGPFGTTGLIGQGSDLPEWNEVDPAKLFYEALEIPIMVSNDANASAMAERITGVAQGLSTYAYLYFGTGLGLGLVSQGHLISGAFGNAGEIGHVSVLVNGEYASLESVLSRLSVQRYLQNNGQGSVDFERLTELFSDKDPYLFEWLDTASQALGHATQIIENMFDPQTIIVGGAMPSGVLDHLVANAPLPDLSVSNRLEREQPRLKTGESSRLTATLGAAALVLNQTYTPQFIPVH
ncbi:ROK family transcriptional regulator [Lentilitoribacter sp. EG35]|uniref:ROK family transcriptional regulator n=1 Tax=Lentilitoribacter sp. EG35 TaxID=3234192 RepID=UPI00346076AE